MTTPREIKVYRDLMGANAEWAAKTRALLAERSIAMVNVISAPGSGKTTLLERMIPALAGRLRFAVLEGDLETTRDAERLDALDIPVYQLLTGGSCHLEAKLVHHALLDLPLDDLEVVIVENVGNLVCPAEFDIGEAGKLAILSVTEGEDKPVKYPLLFHEAVAAVITKIDLLPYVPFKLEECRRYLAQTNPAAPVFEVSSLTGAGMDAWLTWFTAFVAAHR
ncbi:MAG TPA: hydrogenase nickel incorporation protein HypB [Armatimonadota bacterium]|nr:hydrogenase nickel incorporation protein HypB [Armatimonadota bacterium]